MRIGAMLSDISRSLFKRPFTEQYPFKRYPAPERLRGMVVWDPHKCTGCKICVRDCPANALDLVVVDKAAKHFVLRVHTDRCTFCAQCVASCNFDCIRLSADDWELAALTRDPFLVSYGREEDLDSLRP